MAISIKIDPVEQFTTASLRADLSLPERKREAAAFAREGLEEAKQINRAALGREVPYTTTVDGRRDAALETVNPDGGSIIFEFDVGVVDVLQWIAKTLYERSPEVSGRYKRGHKLLADGTETVWPTRGGNIPPAGEYLFINTEPYSRKIEIGKTKAGRAFVIQVPNRIYERTAKDAKAKYGAAADIRFAYVQAVGAYRLKQSVGRRKDRQRGTAVGTPSITVTFKKG